MASIMIKDLNESKDLDRDAMRTIIGGRSALLLKPANPAHSLLLQDSPASNPFAWATFLPGTHTE
jgi:hypothetical protein